MDGTEQFVARQNIRRFEQLLATSTDEKQKKVLRQLVDEEKAKLAPPGRSKAAEARNQVELPVK